VQQSVRPRWGQTFLAAESAFLMQSSYAIAGVLPLQLKNMYDIRIHNPAKACIKRSVKFSPTSLRKNQIGKQGFSPSFNSFQTCEKRDLLTTKKLRTMTKIIIKNKTNGDIG
jgi:hypothetical protein